MGGLRKHRRDEGRVLWLEVDDIRSNPEQSRRYFDPSALERLADSIRHWGVLQPLTVRKTRKGYELVSGERRLRSARLAGLRKVPCLLIHVTAQQADILALTENLQRENLHFAEEARGVSWLMRIYGMSREEVEACLGRSRQETEELLRIQQLPADVLDRLCRENMTPSHALSLLSLQTLREQRAACGKMAAERMDPAAARAYVETLLHPPRKKPPQENVPPRGQHSFIMKDIRIFYNSLEHNLALLKQAGVHTELSRNEGPEGVTLTVRIPAHR